MSILFVIAPVFIVAVWVIVLVRIIKAAISGRSEGVKANKGDFDRMFDMQSNAHDMAVRMHNQAHSDAVRMHNDAHFHAVQTHQSFMDTSMHNMHMM